MITIIGGVSDGGVAWTKKNVSQSTESRPDGALSLGPSVNVEAFVRNSSAGAIS